MNGKLLLAALMPALLSCQNSNPFNVTMSAKVFDDQIHQVLTLAIQEARNLDYPAETMEISLRMEEKQAVAHFAPVSKPGTLITGGDVTIRVGLQNMRVLAVERGQ